MFNQRILGFSRMMNVAALCLLEDIAWAFARGTAWLRTRTGYSRPADDTRFGRGGKTPFNTVV